MEFTLISLKRLFLDVVDVEMLKNLNFEFKNDTKFEFVEDVFMNPETGLEQKTINLKNDYNSEKHPWPVVNIQIEDMIKEMTKHGIEFIIRNVENNDIPELVIYNDYAES
ncbi:MAG: hypothetical protein WBA59_04055 [Moheibacter sp.]